MYIFSNLLNAVATVLNMLLSAYWWIIFARAVISWVQPDPYNPIVRFLQTATDPLLYRIRRALPVSFSGIDLSPIIAMAGIYFLQLFLVQSLFDFAGQLR